MSGRVGSIIDTPSLISFSFWLDIVIYELSCNVYDVAECDLHPTLERNQKRSIGVPGLNNRMFGSKKIIFYYITFIFQ
jgi:hypothetical protein